MSSFKSRKEQEASMKLGTAIKFKDAERRKCSKLVIPYMQKIVGLVDAFKEKSSTQGVGNFTMWHLQLKISKEFVLISSSMLGFLGREDQNRYQNRISEQAICQQGPRHVSALCNCVNIHAPDKH